MRLIGGVRVRNRGFWAGWGGVITTTFIALVIVALLVGWVILWVSREDGCAAAFLCDEPFGQWAVDGWPAVTRAQLELGREASVGRTELYRSLELGVERCGREGAVARHADQHLRRDRPRRWLHPRSLGHRNRPPT